MTLRAAAIATALLLALPLARASAQQAAKDDAARLLRNAAMAEWVTAECGDRYARQLGSTLRMTTRSILRTADAADVGKFRNAVREYAFTFKSRRDACRNVTEYLKSVQ